MGNDWNARIRAQLEDHWSAQLRPRLDGLTDDEYFWEPVEGAWSVRRLTTDTGVVHVADFAVPPPEPAPFTTIAWRLNHLIFVIHGMRAAVEQFGGPPVDLASFRSPGSAAEALDRLDEAYADWTAGVRAVGVEGLEAPAGPPGSPHHDWPTAALVLHIQREVIHHGAEVCLLRDLHRAMRAGR